MPHRSLAPPGDADDGVSLYLVRHAIAAERGPLYPDDDRRPLIARGIERFRDVVTGLVAAGVDADVVLSSPATRTRQTAELLAAALPSRPRVSIVAALAPGGLASDVIDELGRFRSSRRLALVGHAPLIDEVAAALIGGGTFALRKGGVCAIDVEAIPVRRAGTLRWLVTPRLVRGLTRHERR